MSIATEIERLLQAKADLKISIEAKGVSLADDATLDDYPEAVDQIQTGGASNIVQGSFIFSDSGAKNVEIPYEGNGSIISITVKVKGMLDNADFANFVGQHAVRSWQAIKHKQDLRTASVFYIYKSNGTSPTTYSSKANTSYNVYTGIAASSDSVVTLPSPYAEEQNVISVYLRSTSYGFVPGIEYEYIAEFSEQ